MSEPLKTLQKGDRIWVEDIDGRGYEIRFDIARMPLEIYPTTNPKVWMTAARKAAVYGHCQ